ncbi:MAG TPA: transposase [Tepidisphaeraceae bacterium]|jgi:putative transposase
MPRTARIAPGGVIFHVLNRGVGKLQLFRSRKDHEAFQRCLCQTQQAVPMRVLAYCVMSTHWHLVLWPRNDGDLARFMMRLSIRHVRRWLIHRNQVGTGHVYQGRYKSFAIQNDAHLSTVCRYVERNPLRAGLVKSSIAWDWSSAGQSRLPADQQIALTALPRGKRRDWVQWVDQPQTAKEETALKNCIALGRPYGSDKWLDHFKSTLGWREPLKRGRPPNTPK